MVIYNSVYDHFYKAYIWNVNVFPLSFQDKTQGMNGMIRAETAKVSSVYMLE